MWPLERKRDIVRVGRERAERWAWNGERLILRGQETMDCAAGPDAAVLAAALRMLFHSARERGTRGEPSREVDVVFESAWLPVMSLELGRKLWSRTQVEALLRHRLGQLHARRDDPVGDWELQLDHRAGDAHALGYGLAPSVKQAAMNAAAATGRQLASLQPVFAWGWQRLSRHHRNLGGARSGWWVWIEQDRSLVCRIDRGRVIAVNPGAAVPRDDPQCLRLIQIEASRLGVLGPVGRGVAATWDGAESAVRGANDEARMSWVSVAAREIDPPRDRPAQPNAEAAA
ncbi:MAG TPA: hypothetical protein VFA35_07860 [Burkholderiaceae bacterium]|nr:hypothetical protein [Burkholderiaceae bacterium]